MLNFVTTVINYHTQLKHQIKPSMSAGVQFQISFTIDTISINGWT